ncbi:MAG TPA: PIN domain-containing protein [Acidobacteriaceae bacterium]|nr:PIN domain-containing protein [Acidobacteriaceae bacterium]
MSLSQLGADIQPGERILLDSSTLISYLNGNESVSLVATHLIDTWVRSGRNRAVVSMVSVTELLVRPLRMGAPDSYETVHDFLTTFPHLSAMNVTLPIAQETAALRAQWNFTTPDALTIASGIAGQVGWLVTNDDRWKQLAPIARRIRVCFLADCLPFP